MMKTYNTIHNDNLQSLTQYSTTAARLLLDIIITFMIEKEVPLNGSLLTKNDYKFTTGQTYLLCLKRSCVICGMRAEIHHVDAVGMGRNRKKISHIGMKVLPLCRNHHIEAHTIGNTKLIENYHLYPVEIDKTLEHFIKTGNIRVFED